MIGIKETILPLTVYYIGKCKQYQFAKSYILGYLYNYSDFYTIFIYLNKIKIKIIKEITH